METINIKFNEKQLEEVVKKVTEELKKEKADFYELSDTKHEEPKEKRSVMYLGANVSHHASEEKKVYFGRGFNTFTKEYATEFDLSDDDREKVKELESEGWKEEVVYK
ncbi:HNH endonuclease [Lactococcus phage 2R14S]|uniref:HNH endonuclease n=8 Tax=Skunavirus TaxID=1623305 RepID=A0A3G1FH63_9CAUD|nr:HNH endonuclease [Lactococcus phage 10W18]YP_009875845.1 HNH endonuclease [Lactococcus phage 3R16S]ANY28776.1 HNH endonuclease [Lactococcus phage 10W22S]AOQ29551.1 HNH endonuclease [Lactococcus phage 2R14S]AOQ29610.1 HNH endonuclease [Lactococcus phage 2R15M]AOQ29903.1 HNH endonuclease [Lactococcus phage 6W06]AOQ29962.1 HNH endonuclease [Lactococcus phage 6W18L]AOQ30021.1 HNH endonuclease [Lactococcus phage 10W24]AOQ30133.1 HNH endonuclease [Lactococcus phage 17W11]AOQ30194.1 HNH endonu